MNWCLDQYYRMKERMVFELCVLFTIGFSTTEVVDCWRLRIVSMLHPGRGMIAW
jgi:hypothetical protein